MKKIISIFSAISFLFLSCTRSSDTLKEEDVPWKPPAAPEIPVSEKPRLLWIDASANFKYLANHKANIISCLEKAKEAGFTDIVVDVR
ncbi:MAG: S-layer protein, partial [Bacteroidales bacterium]|nr:S-layer protein [Bacteroidales bacterium]